MNSNKYSLTYPQNNILLVDKFNENSPINNIVGMINIHTDFNEVFCQKAINYLIRDNDALRLSLFFEKNECFQKVNEYVPVDIKVLDMSNYSDEEIQKYIIDNTSFKISLQGNTLYNFEVFKFSDNKGCIFMKIHHIIADAWSSSKIGSQLISYLEAMQNNEKIEEFLKPSYLEYIQSEKEYTLSEKFKNDEQFWDEYLADISEPVSLKVAIQNNTTNAIRYTTSVEPNLNLKIIDFCAKNKVSVYAVFLAALSTYIYRTKNVSDCVLGTPVLNRANFKEKQMLGMFVSTIPIRVKMDENMRFLQLVKAIASNTMSLFRHQKYPYAKILENARAKSKLKGNLYNIALSYQNARIEFEEKKYSSNWGFSNNIQDELDIHIVDMDNTGIITVHYDYLTALFESEEIVFLHKRLMALIANAIADESVSLDEINIMSSEEINKIIYEFNNTHLPIPLDKTYIELFEEKVCQTPDNIAIVFEDKNMSYKELNEKSNLVATYLVNNIKVKQNDIVAINLNRSFEMVIAIIAILKSSAAYLPIDPSFPEDRKRYMIKNSDSKAVICNSEICIDNIDNVYIDELVNSNIKIDNLNIKNKLDDLIYMIYTSGTTGNPKGVMITQSNILNLIFGVVEFQKLNECDVWGAFSTYSFDISILEIFVPLFLGKKVVLANEEEQKMPNKMKALIIKNKVDVINITPTRLKILMDFDDDNTSLLSLKRIMLGGEVFPLNLYDKIRLGTDAVIYDGYGPTEITVWSSAKIITNKDDINIGVSLPNVESYILDENNNLLPIGCIGELCISGGGVAKGYYKNEISKDKFIMCHGKYIYKTGDYACFNFKGELVYIGRKDSQIKLHGLRIEIEEIENKILEIKNVIQCGVTINDKEQICAYYCTNKDIDVNYIRSFLQKVLPSYMVPQLYLNIDKFELTTLGKIDKTKLPKIQLEQNNIIAPRDELENEIVEIFKEILKLKEIGINENFFELGIDSLSAINVALLINKKNNINISAKEIFDYDTVEKLSIYIKNVSSNNIKYEELESVTKSTLTEAQKGIFGSYISKPESIVYNIPFELKFSNSFDINRLKLAIKNAIFNSESFFTKIFVDETGVYQTVEKDDNINIECLKMSQEQYFIEKENFVKPFDLLIDKLFKVKIYDVSSAIYVLFDIHHIIFDGKSIYILLEKIKNYYENNGEIKENNEVTMTQVAKYEESLRLLPEFSEAKNFFMQQFSGELPNNLFPLDFPRKKDNTFAGDFVKVKISNQTKEKISDFAIKNRLTVSNIFLAMFSFLISKYTYTEDILLGSAISGTSLEQEISSIGMFVKTIPIRTKIDFNQNIVEYICDVQSLMLQSLKNSMYSYNELINDLNITKGLKNPLFDMMYVYQNAGVPVCLIDGKDVLIDEIEAKVAKFDLACIVMPSSDDITIKFEYSTELFRKETIERFTQNLINTLIYVIENENKKLCDIDIISNNEKELVLDKFNQTSTDYPKDKSISQIFEEIVLNDPQHIALVLDEGVLTYDELNKKANKLAFFLRNKGIKANDAIAILVDKSFEMMISIFGVIKSGGCYIPIDPDLPQDRINYMITNSNTKLILKKSNIDYSNELYEVINLEDENIAKCCDQNIKNINCQDDMAYIIYTSGSTGKPKGVMNTHRGFIKLGKNINYLDLNLVKNVFLSANLVFDASIYEMALTFMNGLTGIIIKKEVMLTPQLYKIELLRHTDILIVFTTQLFHQYGETMPEMFINAKYIIPGGDVLISKYVENVHKYCPDTTIINIYGPAECAAATTTQIVDQKYSHIPIGYPISNTHCYILDKCLKFCPLDVQGELYIGGDGVGKGYINNEQLTNDSFINLNINSKVERVYKSGDIVKWLPKGNIAFMGRKDKQIKIRGFRIEISEIENAVLEFDGIKEVKIVLTKHENDKKLVLYYVVNKEIKLDKLKKSLELKLPLYMIPTFYIKLEKMPLNVSGKIDINSLPDIKEELNIVKYLPENYIERQLMDIVKSILYINDFNITDNLFQIGLDSILVTKMSLEAINKDIKITYSDIFDYPTIKELANVVLTGNRKNLYEDIDNYNYSEIDKLLSKKQVIKSGCINDILLTGSNGFLGCHILAKYLDEYSGIAYCIVRKSAKESGQKRLKDILNYYFGNKYSEIFNTRVKVINEELLSQTAEETMNNIIQTTNINRVIHCAARVKHFGRTDEFYRINVDLTDKIASICAKNNIKLIYVSTLSVSGNGLEGGFAKQEFDKDINYTEQNLYVGQKINNIYTYTKFIAEVKILEKIINNKLDAVIVRVGNLMGRYSDGMFQKNRKENAFIDRIKFVVDNKIIPKAIVDNSYIEISPIDKTAEGVLKIATLNNSNLVYHLYNYNHYKTQDFITFLHLYNNINVKVLDDTQFYEKFNKLLLGNNKKINKTIVADLNSDKKIDYNSSIKITCDFTKTTLKLIDFKWDIINDNYWVNFLDKLKIRRIIKRGDESAKN